MEGVSKETIPPDLTLEAVTYLINHVFIPSKLPHSDDSRPGLQRALLRVTIGSLSRFEDFVDACHRPVVDSTLAMMRDLLHVHDVDNKNYIAINETKLRMSLADLREGVPISMYVHSQNAGVIINMAGTSVSVEAMELSARSEDVINTKGRLRRSFPGSAVSIPVATFRDLKFQAVLAATLAKMSAQRAEGAQPKVKKAGQWHDEDRDTAHPMMVTELLMAFLMPLGEPVLPGSVPTVWKSTRDEVFWHDAFLPWRRSPLWLFIRVALQLALSSNMMAEEQVDDGQQTLEGCCSLYKEFMLLFTADVFSQAHNHRLESDILAAMNAKLARRLQKLDSAALSEATLNTVHAVMHKTDAILQQQWSLIQQLVSPSPPLSRLGGLRLEKDTLARLKSLDEFLLCIADRDGDGNPADFQPTGGLVNSAAKNLPKHNEVFNTDYAVANLAIFETWIATHLDAWLDTHRDKAGVCAQLKSLMQDYHKSAATICSENPEATSAMVLTLVEVWIACDKAAIAACPLLAEYGHGVPGGPLQSLVLPSQSQMERLHRSEQYLARRSQNAKYGEQQVFEELGSASCFSVRYFDQSPSHQSLLAEIEQKAQKDREKKHDEFHNKKARYDRLMDQHRNTECECQDVQNPHMGSSRRKKHHQNCQSHRYLADAKSISIEAHEWPLPEDAEQAKSVVFELRPPLPFCEWRDATIYLLIDVLEGEYKSESPPRAIYRLKDDQGLSKLAVLGGPHRIGLLSETKPNMVTHRHNHKNFFGALDDPDDICLANGLKYRYFDESEGCFVAAYCYTDEIPQRCTYRLPELSKALQRFLSRPDDQPDGPLPNTVIASQSACPSHLALDEYRALCSIPLGRRIQWQNILLQIYAPSVDFKKTETVFTILQSIHQAGAPCRDGVVFREGFFALTDPRFVISLIDGLHAASQRLRENWQSSAAFSTFISLAARVSSLACGIDMDDMRTTDIKMRCWKYLAVAREITFAWVQLIRNKVDETSQDSEKEKLRSRAVAISLICVGSYDLDDDLFLQETLESSSTLSLLLQCHIIIREGAQFFPSADSLTALLIWRWRRLCYRSYRAVAHKITEEGSGALDDAILNSWPAYRPKDGEGWQRASEEHEYWLVTQTAAQGEDGPLPVHFNLVTGELLVNGAPLDRLPSEYERHPVYSRLFGYSSLEVVPSGIPGMRFSGKKTFAGHTLHFALTVNDDDDDAFDHDSSNSDSSNCGPSRHHPDLLIRAIDGRRAFDLVPPRILQGRLPQTFVNDYVHWYDISGQCLEFRPRGNPWVSSPSNWRLTRENKWWRMMKDGMLLIHINSPTAETVAEILSAIENPLWTNIVLHQSTSTLDVDLPRRKLSFWHERGSASLQSRQFRAMNVDENQSIDTLVGFQNKLVLRDEEHRSHRTVLLLEGAISCQRVGGHVCVSVDHDSAVKIHAYRIDNLLGRLISNDDLQSQLLLCHLHALTSFCLPDPLTRETGTEAALSVLHSASVRSFERLTKENVATLDLIARLTPQRRCYPEDKRVMQTVKWSQTLGFLAQHGGFYIAVREILDQDARSRFFHPEAYVEPPNLDKLHKIDRELLRRDDIRSSTFRVSGFGAESHTVQHDVIYVARDRDQDPSRRYRAYAMSSTIFDARQTAHSVLPSDLVSHIWNYLRTLDQDVLGPGSHLSCPELAYDAHWLLDTSARHSVGVNWVPIHEALSSRRFDKFQLMAWLATLAFSDKADMAVVQALALMHTDRDVGRTCPPQIQSARPADGHEADRNRLSVLVESTAIPFRRYTGQSVARQHNESTKSFKRRRKDDFDERKACAIQEITAELMGQWPVKTPRQPVDANNASGWAKCVTLDKAMGQVTTMFKAWHDNYVFRAYLAELEAEISECAVVPLEMPSASLEPVTESGDTRRKLGFISIQDVFSRPAPLPTSDIWCFEDAWFSNLGRFLRPAREDGGNQACRLDALISTLEVKAESDYETRYVVSLRDSLLSLRGGKKSASLRVDGGGVEGLKDALTQYHAHWKDSARDMFDAMVRATTTTGATRTTVPGLQQWPRLSPLFFLRGLSHGLWPFLPDDWKDCIVSYGVALTRLQRAERLLGVCPRRSSSNGSGEANLIRELENPGHTNWRPRDHPESLLLEVESGIMIREAQEQVAAEMRNPPNGKNAVMQLNMGEGKSSVLVPMIAAALADGSRLVRVVVAKPQAKQMLQMLVSRLGGLQGRQIYHMPFSRAVKVGTAEARALHKMFQQCMASGGVLLVQPEHMLSFKLMAVESTIAEKEDVASSLLASLEFLHHCSRDIVDESDENFSVKFELVYTMGTQRPADHSPNRWVCIQEVLGILRMCASRMKEEFSSLLEMHSTRPGCFPRTRFLRPEAQEKMTCWIAKEICKAGLTGLPIAQEGVAVRRAVFRYLTTSELTAEEVQEVENEKGLWASTKNTLLLVRGLLAGGVLGFALGQKRWRVDYGPAPDRKPETKLAVPYRAKDSPAARSEFSHPDVVIILTCLSYYYGGLANDDLFLALNHLVNSDQANEEYQVWVADAPDLPPAFSQLGGINLEDYFLCVEQVFPCLRHAKGAVDYFLAHVVFPRTMREFPHKLSVSGWDVGEAKAQPTTGFSGTNDSRQVLPLAVEQLDLAEQRHTNALVLEHLLRPENSVALMGASHAEMNYASDAERLLAMVVAMNPPVRVIIDVGAQILELDNLGVAQRWLEMLRDDQQTQAAVFFDDNDHLCVLDRKGRVEPHTVSPFATQLDVCLVFLDEAHTRGTDLKLPQTYRAAATLGANLTKDRLTQACMRMRQLGKGQSVVFCVPEEIKMKIEAYTSTSTIGVSDILAWAISETWIDARRSIPLWAAQGRRHEDHKRLWARSRSADDSAWNKDVAKQFLEDEAQTLAARYTPRRPEMCGSPIEVNDDPISQRCRQFKALEHHSATLQEEQERELAPETEQERQVQKPDAAKPAKHRLEPVIQQFVLTGRLPPKSRSYMAAWDALWDTSAAAHLDVLRNCRGRLWATADFVRTINPPQGSPESHISDAYQRPVQWILTSTRRNVSDREASEERSEEEESEGEESEEEDPYREDSYREESNGEKSNEEESEEEELEGEESEGEEHKSEGEDFEESEGGESLGEMLVISPFEANELLPSIEKSRAGVSLHLYAPRPNMGFPPLDGLDLYTVPAQPRFTLPRPLVAELNLFAGQLYVGSWDQYVEMRRLVRGEYCFDENPVEFLKVLLTKIRRDCKGIDKTHLGCILDGKLLGPGDF